MTNTRHVFHSGNMDTKGSILRRLVVEKYGTVKAFCGAADLGRTTAYRLFDGELNTIDVAVKAARALDMNLAVFLSLFAQDRIARGLKP